MEFTQLENSFIFAGIEDCAQYYGYFTFCSYKKGEMVFDDNHYDKKVGFVLSGELSVLQHTVLLNTIKASGAFGVSGLFLEEESFVTQIMSKTATEVAYIDFEKLQQLFQLDPRITLNYIAFLSDRITFLNRKIAALTAPTVEAKVLAYLQHHQQEGVIEVTGGYTKLSATLNIGRASLYRILDKLEDEELIQRRGKIITLSTDSKN